MGRLYLIQLDGRVYSCRYCRSHLAQCDELVSKVMVNFKHRNLSAANHSLFVFVVWHATERYAFGFDVINK